MFKIKNIVCVAFIIGVFSLSGQAQTIQLNKSDNEIGTASVNDGFTKVVLKEGYDVINTTNYGEIRLRHQYLDSLSINKITENEYKLFYKPKPKYYITIKNITVSKNKDVNATFTINLPDFSLDNNLIKVKLSKPNPNIKNKEIMRKYILPVIHDFLADSFQKTHMGGCIETAVKTCGKGNVKFVDVNIFASGCSYECD